MITTQCARCPTLITCWPFRAGVAVCKPCLADVRRINGKRVGAGQRPADGATRTRGKGSRYYVQRFMPDHPDANTQGWCWEHRLVMERMIGRRLTAAEVVHHRDRDGTNNDPANLELIANQGKHLADEHCIEGVAARMAAYPTCACGRRTMFGRAVCEPCEKVGAVCKTCNEPGRKMASVNLCRRCVSRAFKARHRAARVGNGSTPIGG